MPAYKFAGGAQPSVADFAVGGMMHAPISSAQDLLGNPTALRMMERMYQEARRLVPSLASASAKRGPVTMTMQEAQAMKQRWPDMQIPGLRRPALWGAEEAATPATNDTVRALLRKATRGR